MYEPLDVAMLACRVPTGSKVNQRMGVLFPGTIYPDETNLSNSDVDVLPRTWVTVIPSFKYSFITFPRGHKLFNSRIVPGPVNPDWTQELVCAARSNREPNAGECEPPLLSGTRGLCEPLVSWMIEMERASRTPESAP